MKKLLTLGLMLHLISACESPKQEEYDPEALQQAVGLRIDAFYEAMQRTNTEGLLDFYSQDSRFYWVEDGRLAYPTYEAMAKSLGGLVGTLESVNNQELSRKIITDGAERAQVFLEYEQQFTMKGGFQFEINGALTATMTNEDGTWRFLFGHSSVKKERGN